MLQFRFFYLFIVMKGEKKDVRNKITRRYEKELIEKKIGHQQAGFLVGCMCLPQPSQYASMQF